MNAATKVYVPAEALSLSYKIVDYLIFRHEISPGERVPKRDLARGALQVKNVTRGNMIEIQRCFSALSGILIRHYNWDCDINEDGVLLLTAPEEMIKCGLTRTAREIESRKRKAQKQIVCIHKQGGANKCSNTEEGKAAKAFFGDMEKQIVRISLPDSYDIQKLLTR